MSTLDSLKSALTEIAALQEKRNALRESREHLTDQDREMFNRIFDRIDATEYLTLQERTIIVERTKHAGVRSVLGLRVETQPPRRRNVNNTRKKQALQDGPNPDELSGIHSLLCNLRTSIRGGDAAS